MCAIINAGCYFYLLTLIRLNLYHILLKYYVQFAVTGFPMLPKMPSGHSTASLSSVLGSDVIAQTGLPVVRCIGVPKIVITWSLAKAFSGHIGKLDI